MKTKRELVYAYREHKHVYAIRQSNQTILVKSGKLHDSDIEDKYGHRYTRKIDYEQYCKGYMYFSII
jgi:hypothetical protein